MHPPFISIDDLNDFLGTTIAGDDDRAIMALDAACQTIRSYVEQTLNLVRDDMVHFRGFQTLILPELPVIQINEVTLDGDVVAADDFYVGFGGILYVRDWRLTHWSSHWDDIVTVDYDHGYAVIETDVVQDESGQADVERMPSDIRMVALRIATGMYQAASAGVTAGMRSESLGAYSYTRMDGAIGTGIISNLEANILDRYRVKKIPVP